jgi:nucleoid DNA-binding protein
LLNCTIFENRLISMNKLIASSLLLHKKCHLPGIGTLLLVTRSAKTDFLNTRILSPIQQIEFIAAQANDNDLSTEFLKVSEWITTQLANDKVVNLNGIGSFKQQVGGKFHFSPVEINTEFFPDVEAVRVIRQDAIHDILVGDQQSTNTEMIDYFSEKTPLFDRWWVWAIVLSVIGILLLLIYFYQRGFNMLGNIGN